MERKRNIEVVEKLDDGTIRWKKIGGGAFRLGNRIIKPGQIFVARPDEIPPAFRDVVIPQDTIASPAPEKIKVVKTTFTVKPYGQSKSWFDVVNAEGKVLNEKGLTKEKAELLAKELE